MILILRTSNIITQYMIPILLAFGFILFHINRKKIINCLKNKARKNKKSVEIINLLDKSLVLRKDNIFNTLLIPLVLTPVIEIPTIYLVITATQTQIFSGDIFAYILFSGIIAPIAEEVLFRGMFIGFLAELILFRLAKNNKIKSTSSHVKFINLFVVFLTTTLFALCHQNITFYHFIARFISGLWFSYLYLKNDKNLLPPIVAHSVWNISLVVFR